MSNYTGAPRQGRHTIKEVCQQSNLVQLNAEIGSIKAGDFQENPFANKGPSLRGGTKNEEEKNSPLRREKGSDDFGTST